MECCFVGSSYSTMECHSGLIEVSCGCHGRSTWRIHPCCGTRILVLSPPQEEEGMLALQTLGQRQGKGWEVALSSIVGCFGCTLSTQTKEQTSTSGFYYRACLVDVEEEKGWFQLGHLKTEVFHP